MKLKAEELTAKSCFSMTSKVFTKLLGLFILLLVFHTLVMELVFRRFVERSAAGAPRICSAAKLSGPASSRSPSPFPSRPGSPAASPRRLQRVVAFARRIADGDLTARLATTSRRR